MKKISIIMFLSLAASLFTACDKENNDFIGSDNYLNSFSLEKDGVVYHAEIINNLITLTVPQEADLQGATARYEICELATISPDPATVEEWNQACLFTVTSYSGQARNYNYSVVRDEKVSGGNVILATQAELEAFAAEKVKILEGNLIIGEKTVPATEYDTVKNLSSLASLTEVRGNIVINNSFGGMNLDGLHNVRYAGNLYIGDEENAFDNGKESLLSIELPALETVAGQITVNSEKVGRICFSALSEAMSLYVNGKNFNEVSLPLLKTVYGNLTVSSGAAASAANSEMTEFSLPALESVGGNFTLQTLSNLSSLSLPVLKTISGKLNFKLLPLVEIISFPALERVGGTIAVPYDMSGLKSLQMPGLKEAGAIDIDGRNNAPIIETLDFSSLEQVNGAFALSYLNIASLSLESLLSVEGTFDLRYMQSLKELDLPLLKTCNGTFYLYYMEGPEILDISTVENLPELQIIGSPAIKKCKAPSKIAEIEINAASKVADIIPLEGLEEVENLTLSNFRNTEIILEGYATAIKGELKIGASSAGRISMPDIRRLGKLSLSFSSALKTLEMPALEKIGIFEIKTPLVVENINVPRLEEVTESLLISGGSSYNKGRIPITNLDFLNSLKVAGAVKIEYCGNLTDFSGLKNILASISGENWSVKECAYNPTYEDMVAGRYILE